MVVILLVSAFILSGCGISSSNVSFSTFVESKPIKIVATTGMVADLVKNVGADQVDVTTLMPPGSDPHSYRVTKTDLEVMASADMIFINGLNLEAGMQSELKTLAAHIPVIAVSDGIESSLLLPSDQFGGKYDPHIWFSARLWMKAAGYVAAKLSAYDPRHASVFEYSVNKYQKDLEKLDNYLRVQVERIAPSRRVLVTGQDTFKYFGQEYGLQVYNLEGSNNKTSIKEPDVQQLASLIVKHRITKIFVDQPVPWETVTAVQAAVKARGFSVDVGTHLYADSIGAPGSREDTYVSMVRYDMAVIVGTLLGRNFGSM